MVSKERTERIIWEVAWGVGVVIEVKPVQKLMIVPLLQFFSEYLVTVIIKFSKSKLRLGSGRYERNFYSRVSANSVRCISR